MPTREVPFLAPIAPEKILAGLVIVLAGLVSSAQAATITFDTATNNSGPSDVSPAGTVVSAFFFDADTADTSLTINGVSFTNFLNQSTDTLQENPWIFSPVFGTAGFGGDYGTMLNEAAWVAGAPGSLTLNDLTAGDQYSIQLITNDSRGCCGGTEDVIGDAGSPGLLQFGGENPPPDGQFITGTFTADSSGSQNLYFTGNVQINGVVLSETTSAPEPGTASTFLLVGILTAIAAFRLRLRKLAASPGETEYDLGNYWITHCFTRKAELRGVDQVTYDA